MKESLKIAWRNLWRNKRRTIITASSLFFAVFVAILMRSFALGTYQNMLNNVVELFSGHIQIQDKDYFDNPVLDNAVAIDSQLINFLLKKPEVLTVIPKLNLGGLIVKENNSRMSFVFGVDFEIENKIYNFQKRIVHYEIDTSTIEKIKKVVPFSFQSKLTYYYNKPYNSVSEILLDLASDGFDTSKISQIIKKLPEIKVLPVNKCGNDVYLGYELAKYLEANIGDSVVIWGQGFRGAMAIGKFRVVGYLKFPNPAFGNRIVYMPLKTAQIFSSAFETDGVDTTFYVSYISVNTIYQANFNQKNYEKVLNLCNEIEKKTQNKNLRALGWQTLNKELWQLLQLDSVFLEVFSIILYFIIGLGVLGTVIMLLNERKREFGVMMSIGLNRFRLSMIVLIEIAILAIISFVLSALVCLPITLIFHYNPIFLHGQQAQGLSQYNIEPVLKFALPGNYFWEQLLIISVLVFLIGIYIFVKINKLKPLEALRNQ